MCLTSNSPRSNIHFHPLFLFQRHSSSVLHYFSNHPPNRFLLPDPKLHSENLVIVFNILTANSYPPNLIHNYVKRRLNKFNGLLPRKNTKVVLPFLKYLYPKLCFFLKQFNVTMVFKSTNLLSHIIKHSKDLVIARTLIGQTKLIQSDTKALTHSNDPTLSVLPI